MIKNLFVLCIIINSVLMSTCTICGEKISVPNKAIVGGPIIDVCNECLTRYSCKKIEITDGDK